jgi:integrase
MSRNRKDPVYRLHKARGLAVVSLPDGVGGRHDVYLGQYDSPESHAEYHRVLAEWKANHRTLPASPAAPAVLTMSDLLVAYWCFVETEYIKDGKPTSEQDTIRQALRFVRQLYENTPAAAFGPLALKAVRQAMIDHRISRTIKRTDPATGKVCHQTKIYAHGLSRRHINKQIGRVKRLFAWAVENELVPASVHQALLRVKGLKKGKGEAREKPRVKPVHPAFIDAVLPHVPARVAAMIQVQLLCGARPQEIVSMRPIDIDLSGPIWEYRPQRYKTEHHNDEDSPDFERIIFIGPKAQEILKPLLPLCLTDYIFSPIRSERERSIFRRKNRASPLTPSQAARRPSGRPKAPLGPFYNVASYRRAIRRACIKAGVPIWFPLQLRHSAATAVRRHAGLEASQAVLGHRELGVSQVYAEVDHDTARRAMAAIG